MPVPKLITHKLPYLLDRYGYVPRGHLFAITLSFSAAWSVRFQHLLPFPILRLNNSSRSLLYSTQSKPKSKPNNSVLNQSLVSTALCELLPSLSRAAYCLSYKGRREIWRTRDRKDSQTLHWKTNNERHKMNNNIRSPKEADFPLKQENHDKAKASTSSSSSTAQWLRLKDPRIVRISRAFGGKDRHSKVCTVRGLRDRRVRLSVPTAIQLYDLQDRLGFNQPSKVVDWLLNAAKHEIDELPPLQIPPGSFNLCHPSSAITSNNNEVTVSTSQPNEGFNINESVHRLEGSNSNMSKSKVSGEVVTEKTDWNRREEERESLLSRANHHHPSFLGLLNAMPLGYNVNSQWEPNSNDVSHSGNLGFANPTDLHGNINVVPFPALSTLSLSTGVTQPYFPSNIGAMDMDPRQINQYQMLSSSNSQNLLSNSLVSPSVYTMGQSVKPFSLNMMTPKLLHSPNNSGNGSQSRNKAQDYPSK